MANTHDRKETEALLAKLVACPSVNPGPRPQSGPPFGEKNLAVLLDQILTAMGGATQIDEYEPGRANILATFEGRDPSRRLLFEAHADTVSVEGMDIPPFTPEIRNGRMFGRGACDDKGPMAAMLLGIRHAMARGPLPVTVCFAATADEELGATGAERLVAGGFRPDVAVVGEPTDLSIIHAHKGVLRWRIETHGVSAHSSDPSRGINAIYRMQRIITAIEHDIAPALAGVSHPLLGSPTVSVGTIQGGSQVNIVPSSCVIEVDRRVIPGEDLAAITADLVAHLDGIRDREPDFRYHLEETQRYPTLESERTDLPCRLAAEACRRILGEVHYATAPWAANAGVFDAAGIPSVLFGPGSITQAHTKDESIAVDEVQTAADIYAAMIEAAGSILRED